MRLRTRLILSASYLVALVLLNSHPWLRILATGLFTGVILIQMSERRIRGASDHATLNLHR